MSSAAREDEAGKSAVDDRDVAGGALGSGDVGPEAEAPSARDATIVEQSGEVLVVQVERGLNLHDLMLGVYGRYRPDLIDRILQDNPEIEDPDLLFPGQVLRLPPPEDD
jgi:nucleoid-associated protein YgaU